MKSPQDPYRYISYLSGKRVTKKIFFLHMPKCGGTSIYKAIKDGFGLFEKLHGRNIFGLDPGASLKSSQLTGDSLRDCREQILLYHMSKEQQKLIYGHFFYSQKSYEAFGLEWEYITILREPVSKWFSQYFYNRFKKSDHFKLNAELESFLDSDESLAMGRDYVCNLTDGVSLNDAASTWAIEQAINNLGHFSVVGILEKLDLFSRQYEEHFNAKLSVKNYNSNPLSKNKQDEMISESILSRVQEICIPNTSVYESVLSKIV